MPREPSGPSSTSSGLPAKADLARATRRIREDPVLYQSRTARRAYDPPVAAPRFGARCGAGVPGRHQNRWPYSRRARCSIMRNERAAFGSIAASSSSKIRRPSPGGRTTASGRANAAARCTGAAMVQALAARRQATLWGDCAILSPVL